MKIDSIKFREFVEKCTIGKKIKHIGLQFTDNGIIARAMDGNIAVGLGLFQATSIQDYSKSEGVVGIKNVADFVQKLGIFKGLIDILINVEKKQIVLRKPQDDAKKKKESGELFIKDVEFIEGYVKEDPGFMGKFDAGVEMDSEILKNAVKHQSILQQTALTLEIRNKEMSITVGKMENDYIIESVPCDYKDMSAKYGSIFSEVIGIVGKKISLSMFESNGPILIKEKTQEYVVNIVVAPITVEETQAEESVENDGEKEPEQE